MSALLSRFTCNGIVDPAPSVTSGVEMVFLCAKTPNGVSSMRSNIEIIRLVDILLIFGYFNVIL